MIDLWQAAVMGVVQGLTEFLPISSTGHLILLPAVLGWSGPVTGLEFAVALHVGTLAALLAAFWREWLVLGAACWGSLVRRSLQDRSARLGWLIALGTVPAAAAGLVIESQIEGLRSPLTVGVLMVVVAVIMALADRWSARERDEYALGPLAALIIGSAQAVALAPGVSRSGITIVAGLGLGLTRASAARFSFLLSAPIIAGAAAKEGLGVVNAGPPAGDLAAYGVGILAAGVSGYVAIRGLIAYLGRRSLLPFVVYRIAIGLAVIALSLSGRI